MRIRPFPQAILLGTWLVAACSSSESGSTKKTGDGGPTSDADTTGTGADGGSSSSSGGRASAGGGTSVGGTSGAGTSAGGSSAGGGASANGGTSAAGGASAAGGRNAGAGGRNVGGACGDLALCCPTAGIFRPSCEQQVATGMAASCSVLTGLYCQADGGARPNTSDAGGECTDLRACCATLKAANDKTQCGQIVDLGNEGACAQIHAAYCP